MKIKDLCVISLFLALLIVASKLVIPIGPIPMTLQTLVVLMIGLVLGIKKGLVVFLTFILMGLIGIPVFSSGGGPAYALQPSFGFILGFLLTPLITGIRIHRHYKIVSYIQAILGLLVLDIVGLIYMYFIFEFYLQKDTNIIYILEIGFTPFILKDMASALVAAFMVNRLRPVLNKYNVSDVGGA